MRKVPIWDEMPGQLTRILRYRESKEIISAADPQEQGKYHMEFPWSRRELQIFLQVHLFTGLRVADVVRLMRHPELYQDDGSLLMSRSVLGGGKEKVRSKSFVSYTSALGREIIEKSGFFSMRPPAPDNHLFLQVLRNIIAEAAKNAGFEVREYNEEEKKPKKDQYGIPITGSDGKIVTVKTFRTVHTTGVNNLTFRKTWDSWLINSFGSNPMMVMMIEKSMGHDINTALKHYLTFQFDEEDMQDIRKATEGFGPKNFRMPEYFTQTKA